MPRDNRVQVCSLCGASLSKPCRHVFSWVVTTRKVMYAFRKALREGDTPSHFWNCEAHRYGHRR